jgi:hypothetical protein
MSKEQTSIFKGIAILMMLWLHLFNNPDIAESCTPLIFIGNVPLVHLLTRICSPVNIFIILSGYGLHFVYQYGDLGFRKQSKRLLKLFSFYWLTLLIFVPVGSFVNPDRYPGDILEVIGNITSYLSSYNSETWFLFPYMLTSLTALWIFRIQSKLGNVVSLILSGILYFGSAYIISRYIAPQKLYDSILSHLVTYFEFLFPMVIGGWIHDLHERNKLKLKSMNNFKVAGILLVILLLKLLYPKILYGPIFAALFILIVLQFKNINSGVKEVFHFFGKYSMPMWLIHSYFCYHLFHDFIYGFQYPIAIYGVLLIVTMLVAIPLFKVHQHLYCLLTRPSAQ